MRVDPDAEFGTRSCPGCACEVPANNNRCPVCRYEFPDEPRWARSLLAVIAIGLVLVLLFVWVVARGLD